LNVWYYQFLQDLHGTAKFKLNGLENRLKPKYVSGLKGNAWNYAGADMEGRKLTRPDPNIRSVVLILPKPESP
jgi:hypothetical protein